MREIFQRVEDKTVVYYEVEMDAGSFKKSNPWLLSVFIKFDSLDESQEGYEEFLETKESLIIALEHEQKVNYVGSRVLDGWSEFYFYASDAKELTSMASAIVTESGYVYESNVVKDKKWNLYETQLFPKELEQHNIQSSKIIFLLEEEGDILEKSRVVEHYISFETPTQKNRFLSTLNIEGFEFKDDLSSDEFAHGVALTKEHSVDYTSVTEVVAKLFEAVKSEKGYYEGWSTTLMLNNEDSE